MKRRPTNYFTRMLFMMSLVVWVLGGGMAFSQTPEGATPDPPPTVQEEPGTSEEQDEVIERGIRRGFPRRLPGLLPPKPTAPSAPAPKVFAPSVGGPSTGGTLSQRDRYTAPTPSLTAVANAIQLKFKSLTTILRVPSNLPGTVPVEISVGYFSPAASRRLTKNYTASADSADTLFLYYDAEGDGKPRAIRLDISLRELVPGGRSFSFSLPITLDPLYDVTVSPLRFSLYNDCDTVGKSEVILRWRSPDGQEHSIPKFSIHKGKRNTKHVPSFAWLAREVSTQRIFFEPLIVFNEDDLGYEFEPPPPSGGTRLLPGKTQDFDFFLNEGESTRTKYLNTGKCTARVKYNITRTLLKFPHQY